MLLEAVEREGGIITIGQDGGLEHRSNTTVQRSEKKRCEAECSVHVLPKENNAAMSVSVTMSSGGNS